MTDSSFSWDKIVSYVRQQCINSFAKLAGMIMLCSFFSFLKSISSSIYANNVCALARWTKNITERFMLENSLGNCLLCCGICFSATYPPKGNESVTYDNKMKVLLKYLMLQEKVLNSHFENLTFHKIHNVKL